MYPNLQTEQKMVLYCQRYWPKTFLYKL